MTNKLAHSYAEIFKMEDQADGTVMVYGKATDDSIDSDAQICDMAWLSKAMPLWFKTGGNIREQHSSIAAGVAKEMEEKSDGYYLNTLIVDDGSVKKLKAGVFKGFSIGIRGARVVRDEKAANGRIIDGQIVEISLVDRPANPNARLILAKSEGTEVVQVEELIETSEAPVTDEVIAEPEIDLEPVDEEQIVAPLDSVEAKAAKLVSEQIAAPVAPVAEVVKIESGDLDIKQIIADAVKSAGDFFTAKFEEQNVVIKTASETITKLQEELATANNKVAKGGPMRTTVTAPEIVKNEFKARAQELRNKAAKEEDQDLARGYRDLAADFEAKAVL